MAHKLAIRLDADDALLVQVRMHSLLSKYFSESSRNVATLFEHIVAQTSQRDLVVVLLDEVESLGAARATSLSACEPTDALRLVNALLNGIDALRTCDNCVLLATSNLAHGVDDALLDRVDVLQYIDLPHLQARHTILDSCVVELIRCNVVAARQDERDAHTITLTSVARQTAGFSGRMLRKLPLLALANAPHSNDSLQYSLFIKSLHTAARTMSDTALHKHPSAPTL